MIDAVEKTLSLGVSPERVWRALTEPSQLARWFPDRAELSPEVGSAGWFEWEAHGRYAVRVEVSEPPTRLVWTWARDPDVELDAGPRTTVEWRLEPRSDGGTTVHLRESGFAAPKYRDRNDAGWDEELAELVELLEGRPVRSDGAG